MDEKACTRMEESLRKILTNHCYCGRAKHELCDIEEAAKGLGEPDAGRGIVLRTDKDAILEE